MAKYVYNTKGVCSRKIYIEVEDNKIKDVKFDGGCSGNTQGLSIMVKDNDIEEVIKKLKGVKCGLKNTSCPDQLAIALEEILAGNIQFY